MAQLPAEALPVILALLPAESLGRAACVCTAWRAAAAAPAVWRAAYTALFVPEEEAELRRAAALAGTEVDWRGAVRDRFVAGASWLAGRCSVRQLPCAGGGANGISLLDDHLMVCRQDGFLDVHALSNPAAARPTRMRGAHPSDLFACSGDPASGLVLTASEACVCVWRSAACMARRGDGALLATLPLSADVQIQFACLLPHQHAGALAPAFADAQRRAR